jgi:hypothetical protein
MKTQELVPSTKVNMFEIEVSGEILLNKNLTTTEIISRTIFVESHWGNFTNPRKISAPEKKSKNSELVSYILEAKKEIKNGVKVEDLEGSLLFSPLKIRDLLESLRMLAQYELEKIGVESPETVDKIKFQLLAILLADNINDKKLITER